MNVASNLDRFNKLEQGFNWSLVLGIIMMLLGIVAIAHPFFATLFTELWLGWLFILSGIVQGVYAFKTRDSGRFFLKFLLGFSYLAAGLMLLVYPLQGVLALTFVIGSCILAQSLIQIVLSSQIRPNEGWMWVLFSGILGVFLGSLIILHFPYNAPWLIGLLVGINFIADGISIIMFSTTASNAIQEVSQKQTPQLPK